MAIQNGQTSPRLVLLPGSNVVRIFVVAADRYTRNDYVIHVARERGANLLSSFVSPLSSDFQSKLANCPPEAEIDHVQLAQPGSIVQSIPFHDIPKGVTLANSIDHVYIRPVFKDTAVHVSFEVNGDSVHNADESLAVSFQKPYPRIPLFVGHNIVLIKMFMACTADQNPKEYKFEIERLPPNSLVTATSVSRRKMLPITLSELQVGVCLFACLLVCLVCIIALECLMYLCNSCACVRVSVSVCACVSEEVSSDGWELTVTIGSGCRSCTLVVSKIH
jgi:hypothetical protein